MNDTIPEAEKGIRGIVGCSKLCIEESNKKELSLT